ncbi:MAG: hypothetical protein AB1489_10805 [Acidobacteriota bacterium]
MDRANTTLNVKIAGQDLSGEAFLDIATLEPFGNFGVIIHTCQPLRLGDVVQICGADGQQIASAEVVWVRTGDKPAVEALLYHSLEMGQASYAGTNLSAPTPMQPLPATTFTNSPPNRVTRNLADQTVANLSSSEESIPCPSCSKMNPPNNISCRYCGSYIASNLAGPPSQGSGASRSDVKPTGSLSMERSLSASLSSSLSQTGPLSTGPLKRLPRERSETAALKPNKIQTERKSVRIATLTQYRKISFAALIVLLILFAATLVPVGTTTPTPFDLVEQTGCLDINSLKTERDNTNYGTMEYWTQADNGAVQFIPRSDITISQAAGEINTVRQSGVKLHGYWCPKTPATMVENPSSSQIPASLGQTWVLKPVGANADTLSEVTLRWQNGRLLLQESLNQKILDRTQDINKASYYTGLHKLVIKLNDPGGVDSPVLKEFSFYLSEQQDTIAAAEGRLTNATYQIYLGRPTNLQTESSLGVRRILTIVLGIAILATLIYISINYQRSRALA